MIDVDGEADGPRRAATRSSPGDAPSGRRPPPRYAGGVMAKYAALVSSASEGAVTTGRRLANALRRS